LVCALAMSATTSTPELQTFQGHCHCGKFAYDFKHQPLDQSEVVRCNCSICDIKGYLLIYCDEAQLKFTKGSRDDLTKYLFNRKMNAHFFCPECGSGVLALAGKDAGPWSGKYGVNLRCVEGLDYEKLVYKDMDGRHQW